MAKYLFGPWSGSGGGGGSGTVTSVGLAAPSIFTVSGSPVTTSGTLTLTLANQAANTVFAGPASGGAAPPTFRALVPADLPATGTLKIDLYDPVTTSVTSGPAIASPFVIDGVTVTNNMLVLFSNLGSGNNEVYKATIAGPVITWTAQSVFSAGVTPSNADQVIVKSGTGFANQTGEFNGTTWLFNFTFRQFNGIDYFEQSALTTSTLADNTTNGTVFTVAFAGSQNMIVDYSLLRNGSKEAGMLEITTDGTTASVSSQTTYTAMAGVSFSATISGANIILQYTTTSTGFAATMKYSVKRWSDTAGGPAGLPSYTSGSSPIPAAGLTGSIQINSGGVLGSNTNLIYDTTNNLFQLGGMDISILNSAAIADNTVGGTLVSMPVAFSAIIFEYSISRGTNFRTGRVLVTTDGTLVSSTDDYAEQGTTGVTLSTSISGGFINLLYTSTATGTAGTFKYTFKRWAA